MTKTDDTGLLGHHFAYEVSMLAKHARNSRVAKKTRLFAMP
jgi:hypothetical protein